MLKAAVRAAAFLGRIMKVFRFVNAAAKREFGKLPKDIQLLFATSLNAVAQDQDPLVNFKHIADSVGKGAIELIENGSPAYRAVYCAKFGDTIFLLHSFVKTTNGVDKKAMNTVKKRYKDMMDIVKKESL
ncbi:type II toxin-antitoxin system RelE/ParE family toxin [Marinomonas polaris]|uniref:type II toxin-antitoxin system RelE/ParE family toxin n=1 Tax=Marinomonas polaris TaxID=293552 RepID=UPI0035126A5D